MISFLFFLFIFVFFFLIKNQPLSPKNKKRRARHLDNKEYYIVLPGLHAQCSFAGQDSKTVWIIWPLRLVLNTRDGWDLVENSGSRTNFFVPRARFVHQIPASQKITGEKLEGMVKILPRCQFNRFGLKKFHHFKNNILIEEAVDVHSRTNYYFFFCY